MKRILIIDDEINILKIFGLILIKNGCEVDTASTLEEAKSLINNKYDFIFLDYYINNESVISFLKKHLKLIDINTLCILSGTESKEDIKKLNKLGIIHFIKKPIPYEYIIKMIHENS